MLRLVFSMAFCFAVVGACLVFVSKQMIEDAQRLDPDWEQVTLSEWIDGETNNDVLFEVSDFDSGDEYWALTDRDSDDFDIVYVPLFKPGEKDNTGAAAVAVVGLRDASNADDVEQILSSPTLSVQGYHGEPPAYAANLSESYPQIDWSKTRWAIVDNDLPDEATAFTVFGIGGVLCMFSFLAGLFGLRLWFRQVAAKRRGFVASAEIHETSGKVELAPQAQGSSFSSETLPKIGKWCGVVSMSSLLIGIVLVALRRVGAIDDTIAMHFIFVFSPLFLITGAIGTFSYFFANPKLRIQSQTGEQLPAKIRMQMEIVAREFQKLGYQFIGFAEAEFLGKKHHAYLHSPNRQKVVEVTLKGGKISWVIVGVTDDGLVYELGKTSEKEDLYIDATSSGVPLAADLKAKCDVASVIAEFERFNVKVRENGGRLLEIPVDALFHLMHYELILTGWWAYNKSMRFSKPEPMPGLNEVTKDGVTFDFRRDDSYENDFVEQPTAWSEVSSLGGYATSEPVAIS